MIGAMSDSPAADPPQPDAPADSAGDPVRGAARALSGFGASATAFALAFVLLRVFAVSGYDWDTAFAVSTTLSLSDALTMSVGSLMGDDLATSIALMCLLPLLAAAVLWSPGGRRAVVVIPTVLSVVMLVALTLTYHRWWMPVVAAVILAVFAVSQHPPRRLPLPMGFTRAVATLMARVGAVAAVVILVGAALFQQPWVPLEEITTETGVVHGYVLSVPSGFLNVLVDDPREFLILNSSDVINRR